jgi:DNA-binding beta-propeller fold protein YncE
MTMKKARWPALIALALTFASCREASTVSVNPPPASAAGAYVVNEGTFTAGGSLSYYDAQRDTMFNDVIASDWIFPNDLKVVAGKGYLAVNGSDRVDVIDLGTNHIGKSIHTPQFSGPGYLAGAGSELVVANYDGTLSLITTADDSLRGTSGPVVAFPGGIAVLNGRAFVSDFGTYVSNQFVPGHFLKVVSPATLQVTDSVRLSDAPGSMTVLNGKLFVVCAGTQSVQPRLYQVDPATHLAEDSLLITGAVSDIATDGHSLFVLEANGVGKFDVQPLRTVASPFITRAGGIFYYALAADAASGDIYVTNVVSSGGSGRLEIYTYRGLLKRTHQQVGIFPGAMAFK